MVEILEQQQGEGQGLNRQFEKALAQVADRLPRNDRALFLLGMLWQKVSREHSERETDLSAVKAELEVAKKQLAESLIDPVTKLPRREQLYRQLEQELEALFNLGEKPKGNLSFLDGLEQAFNGFNSEALKDIPLSLMMSDVAFLALANKFGHAQGDQFLFNLGQVARDLSLGGNQNLDQTKFKTFRHAGDEITGIIKESDQEKISEIIQSFQVEVENIAVFPFVEMGIKPTIDIGVVHLGEAVEGFKKFLAEIGSDKAILNCEGWDCFIEFWLEIADRRANIAKGIKRIKLLIDLKAKDPDKYKSLSVYTRKGSFETTDEELDALAIRRNDPNWDKLIFDHLVKKMEQIQQQQQNLGLARQKIIDQIADRAFKSI